MKIRRRRRGGRRWDSVRTRPQRWLAVRRRDRVRAFCDGVVIAHHLRSNEPHALVEDAQHRTGLFRSSTSAPLSTTTSVLARPLAAYDAIVVKAALPRGSADSPPIPKRIGDELRGHDEGVVAGGAA